VNGDTSGLFTQKMDLNLVSMLFSAIAGPYQMFVDVARRALRETPDKSLRDVRRERIESIIKSIDFFQRRLITRDEREQQSEILKLEVALMCLKSSYLERRI
jgi:hypothetical protein